MREFLDKVGIKIPGRFDGDEYVIDIDDSNQYAKVFSLIDKCNFIHEIEDDSVFDINKNSLYYEAEKYELQLDADLEKDEYKLTVRDKVED